MKNLQSWLDEYGESHRNPTNKAVHWVCVPVIFFSIVGLLYGIKLPVDLTPAIPLNVAMIAAVLVWLYYLQLSRPIATGMLLVLLLCLWGSELIEKHAPWPLWAVCLVLFAAAWVGQFWGHKVEGKKPSFFKDIQFLMIGPAWLMHFLFRKWHIRY
ncbi:Mpo1 family 2-hydroxy fatty acid dioxygenase [Siphonobacter aquaeclarae]|uniref:Uncharacterized membrane protein YGL010W n=1 Tax=Siphonobacter aquaeclarae TaxID=563176 RepID=A0A1G9PU16_9BACT|nr:Mpo1-like protein [Siphonobacter aquaeclarae]SDM02282.1 Uncharacterized membrane protein YGL010W [Siphonobacter aquaeclarae]